jgi:hypothetical protein
MSNPIIQDILTKAFENAKWLPNYTIKDEVEYIKGLTDDPVEIIEFFDIMYEGHPNIRFNRTTLELEYFDENEGEESESESDDELACCFCENILIYGGNNAYPLNTKKCCDDCNSIKVIPARFREFMESRSDLENLLG